MGQLAFFFDGTRCTGCKTCMFACKDAYDLGVGNDYRKVYECTGGETTKAADGTISTSCFSYYVSLSCCHCASPVCTEVCPTRAMAKDEETGLGCVDAKRCIGCGYCHLACPYNAPHVDAEKGHSVKCDGCRDLVAQGKTPVCVAACPARALQFGDVDTMAALGERADIFPLPPADITYSNLFIKPNRDMRTPDAQDVALANEAEVK